MLIQFGPWRPDTAGFEEPGQANDGVSVQLTDAVGMVPAEGAWEAQPTLQFASKSLSSTCYGAFSCTDAVGRVNWFAGTTDNLSRLTSGTTSWAVVGAGTYALTTDDHWSFAQYGNQVFASAVTNDMQFMTLSAGATFADVGGAPPRFRYIAVVKNFLVGASTATDPQRVQWCGIDNPQTWTIDATTFADFQDLLGPGGWNRGIVTGLPGADAAIIQERAVWRMSYVGPPLVWAFDPVEAAHGAVTGGSIVVGGGRVFYRSDDGFFMFDGSTSTPIGHAKVDRWWAEDADATYYESVTAMADPERPLVFWSYRSTNGSYPDHVIVYNWQSGEWSRLEQSAQVLWEARDFTTGAIQPAAFTVEARAAVFTGNNYAASLVTAEYQLSEGRRTFVKEVWPLVEGDLPTTTLEHRKSAVGALTTTSAKSVVSLGFAPFRVEDRYFRLRHDWPKGASWSKIRGAKVIGTVAGRF